MTTPIRDYTPLLKEAIADAKAAGLASSAGDLESAATAAYTSSSEMLQEHGLAIQRFLKATRATLPPSIRAKLEACLIETEMASSGWRKLKAALRRSRTLG
jgi:hypothetical protein